MRRRLNLLALAVTSMVAVAFLIPLLGLVSDIARDRALNAAEQDAQLVSQLIAATSDAGDASLALEAIAPGGILNGRAIAVATNDGSVAGSPIPAGESLEAAFGGAASNMAVSGGRAVLVPAFQPGGVISVVRILVTDGELTAGVLRAQAVLVGLSMTLVAIAVLVTDRLARSIVRPVQDLSAASAELARGNLGARVTPAGPPEIVEVSHQFNRLAGEVAALLQAERETAADLSHRLRTPLTAARLDTERIGDEAARELIMGDLDEIERSVDHAIGVLRRPGRSVASSTNVEEVARSRAEFWEALATEQDRHAEAVIPRSTTAVGVATDDLTAAIDALIGNVFAHTAEGIGYRLTVETTPQTATVTIEDSGPGFAHRQLLPRGASAAGSTGLGLDIARRTAELAGGGMTIGRSELGGAAVTLELPRR